MARLFTCSFILAFILLTFTTYAQTKKKKSERDSTKQWEIGLDILWFIDKNQVPPINIQIKKHIKQDLALRFRIGIQYDQSDSARSTFPGPPNSSNSVTVFLRSGFENQKMIANKLTFYNGIDFGIWHINRTSQTTLYIADFLSYGRFEQTYKMWQFELLPFIGIKYHIIRNLSISLESSISIYYSNEKYSSTGESLAGYPPFGVGPYEGGSDKIGVRLVPFQYLNLSYKF